MTGFGSSSGLVEGVEYTVEIKSVNNRYLKINQRLPELIQPLEAEIESLVRKTLQRGSVSLTVRMKVSDEMAAYRVNTAALNSYLDQIRPIEVEANPILRLDLGTVLQLPGVCEPPPLDDLAEKTRDGLLLLVRQAVEALVEMRLREGKTIAEDLRGRAEEVRTNLECVAGRCDVVVKSYHERLRTRVDELTAAAKINIDAETLAREVAIYAERCDVAEEISRLRAHLRQFEDALAVREPMGRKMDFIAQEMLREANTIGSKSSDAEIAQCVVDIKTAIDRIKEQAANVE
jgi:uncharacterized protein (TIGR00255 family)